MIEISKSWKDECGVFGVWNYGDGHNEAARLAYLALYAMQHRGQESCGIVSLEDKKGTQSILKGLGLVGIGFKSAWV